MCVSPERNRAGNLRVKARLMARLSGSWVWTYPLSVGTSGGGGPTLGFFVNRMCPEIALRLRREV